MTDKQALFGYRLKQAEETLRDAEKMLQNGLSPRSIINRAYYSIFYAILALLIKLDINPKTSKHTRIITMFDKEFVHTKKVDKSFSKILHRLFDMRQAGDYKELVELTSTDAQESINGAKEFVEEIKKLIFQNQA